MHATPTNLGLLDRLPAPLRHLLIAMVPLLTGYLSADVIPALQGHPGVAGVLAFALQALVLALTPLTRQYGVGAPAPWDSEPDPTAPVPDPTVPSPREPSPDETDQDIPEAA